MVILLGVILGGKLYGEPAQTPLLSDLDIPLMQGFYEEEDSRVVFDTPEGRIIEVRAVGPHTAQQVIDYYRVVLPSLAWRVVAEKDKSCDGPSAYCIMARRDLEILTLKIKEKKGSQGTSVIYFSVNPE